MRISVIGCGYLGAVHAVAMTKLGHEVVAVDIDETRISLLASGRAPFFEPGFDDLLAQGLASGSLSFTTDFAATDTCEVHFLAVGTPQAADSNAADLSYVRAALDSLIPHLADDSLVVGKSTVPVGTAADLAAVLAKQAPGTSLAWNPEFLREGFAIEDTLEPDRIVYGVSDDSAGARDAARLDEIYAKALANGTPRIITDYATAELVKVAANAFLATKISFINAMAEISEVVGADVTHLADAIGHDARIGRRFLNSGVGFGGGCLPKDIRAFSARAEELGVGRSVAFLHEIDAINLRRRDRVIELTVDSLGGDTSGKRVAVLGASFKPNSDDVRDSPALSIAARLLSLGADVVVTDPEALQNARLKHPELNFESDVSETLRDADVVLLLTEWAPYRGLDPQESLQLMRRPDNQPTIIDGRNCLEPARWKAAGWNYRGLGR